VHTCDCRTEGEEVLVDAADAFGVFSFESEVAIQDARGPLAQSALMMMTSIE
jgi:hypothetical protein